MRSFRARRREGTQQAQPRQDDAAGRVPSDILKGVIILQKACQQHAPHLWWLSGEDIKVLTEPVIMTALPCRSPGDTLQPRLCRRVLCLLGGL